jgi:hypothetical protein
VDRRVRFSLCFGPGSSTSWSGPQRGRIPPAYPASP